MHLLPEGGLYHVRTVRLASAMEGLLVDALIVKLEMCLKYVVRV